MDDIVKAVLIRGGMLVEEDFGDFRSPGKLRFCKSGSPGKLRLLQI